MDQRIFQMEAGVMALLEQFEGELLALVQRDVYQPMPHIVITGLLELAGTMMKNGVLLEPETLPTTLQQIDLLRAHVMPAGGEPISH